MNEQISVFHREWPTALPLQGRLRETPAYSILQWAEQQEFTGRVLFLRDERSKQIDLRKGEIHRVASNLVPEGLDLLLHRGFLDAKTIALLTDAGSDDRVLQFLRKKGLLTQERIVDLIRLQMEEVVLNLLGWFNGTYELVPGDRPLDPATVTLRVCSLLAQMEKLILDPQHSSLPWLVSTPTLPPITGEIRSLGGASLFASCARWKATGALLLERGHRRKLFQWKGGHVASIASSDPGETLGVILDRWKFLQPEIISHLESRSRKEGVRLRDLIRRDNLLTEARLSEALITLHTERILEAFSWRSGTFHFRGEFDRAATVQPYVTAGEIVEDTTDGPSPPPEGILGAAKTIADLAKEKSLRSLLFLHFSGEGSAFTELEQLVSAWSEVNLRCLIVEVGVGNQPDSNPSTWEDPRRWREFVRPLSHLKGDYLPLPDEDGSWRTAEGITRLKRLVTATAQEYHRVLWCSKAPTRGSPLLFAVPQVVLVLTEGESSEEAVRRALDEASGAEILGFVFRQRGQVDTWAGLKQILNTSPLRWRSQP